MIVPEVYNIIAEWNKEAKAGKAAVYFSYNADSHGYIYTIYTKNVSAMSKYEEKYTKKIQDFYNKYSKCIVWVVIYIKPVQEIIGSTPVDPAKYLRTNLKKL